MTLSIPSLRDSVPGLLWALFATALVALSVRANAQVSFEDVSEQAGFSGFTESWGASIGDMNGDNCLDIFVQGHRDYPRVYRNTCTGVFEDIAYEMDDGRWIAQPTDDKHGVSFGDFDNDGDEDIFMGVSVTGDAQFWVNQGNGAFIENANFLGVRSDFAARVAGFVDFTHDGKLDVFQMGLSPGNWFRFQNSQGRYSTQSGTGQGCVNGDINYVHFMDINDDGRLEIICVERGVWPNLAYDYGSIPFADVTATLPALGNVNSTIIGDFDRNLRYDVLMIRGATRPTGAAFENNTRVEGWIARDDGDPANYGFAIQTTGSITMTVWNRELSRNSPPYVVNIAPGTSGCTGSANDDWRVCMTYNGSQNRYEVNLPNEGQAYVIAQSTQAITNLTHIALNNRDNPIAPRLYMNTASGWNYTPAGLNVPVNCGGGAAGDFDNDMDVDIYLTCGRGAENIPNRMFLNNGNGNFTQQGGNTGAQGPLGVGFDVGVAEGAVFGDYDLDGFLDLFVTNGLLYYPFGKGGPDILLHNLGNSNHWLQIKLQGVASNRDGMGAKVYVTAGGVTQLREQDGGYTRWAQNQQWLHFGLAGNTTANVQVRWPSGHVDNFNGVAADRLFVATEGGNIAPLTYGLPVFTTLLPGDECGEPPYDLNFGPATFLWKDCGTDTWHFRAKGGRSDTALRTQGTITGNSPFSGVSGVGLAGGDSVNTSPATRINLNVGVTFTQDKGFDFSTTGQNSACVDFTRQDIRHFIVGASGKRITKPIDLVTLIGCGEEPPVDLSIADASASEDTGSLTFIVSLAQPTAADVTFLAATSDGTARVSGNDYTSLISSPYTIPAGSLSVAVPVQVGVDAAAEPDETLLLNISSISSNARPVDISAAGTIINDDGPLPVLTIADASAFEDTGAINVTVSLNKVAADATPFTVNTQGQTATFSSGDYSAIINQPYSIPAGSLATTITVVLGVDLLVEANETLLVNLSNVGSNVTLGDGSAVATILNDDTGVPNLSIADASANENSGTLSFTVSLNQTSASNVTFTATTANGTATVANGDYTALAGQPGTITAGSLSTTVVVPLGADGAVEPDETFTVTLSNVSANANVIDGTATGTIRNDDATPPDLTIADDSADEDDGTLSFTVSLNQTSASNVTFTATTADDTATAADGDYTPLVSQPGTIPAGSLSTTVVVALGADGDEEADETFTVSLAGVANANVVDGTATGVILNDDVDGPVTVDVETWLGHAGPVTTAGKRITYLGPSTGWNSTVYSTPLADLGFTNDFEVRFEIQGSQAGTLWVAGLGVTEGGADFRDVDYGVRGSNGQMAVYENGTWRTNGPALASGDVVSIFVSDGTIEYRRNGAMVYSSTFAGSPAFYVDTAFKSGTVVLDVTVFGENGGPVDPPSSQPIVNWLNQAGGVSSTSNNLSHTGTPNSWTNTINSVALSSMGAAGSYTVSWTVTSNPAGTTWVVGIGVNETGPDITDIEFGLRSSAGTLNARQGGTWLANGGAMAVGDTLAIRVTGTLLEYQRNGVTFASTTIAGTEDFYIDTAFKNGAIQLGNFTLTQ